MKEQQCPICKAPVQASERYPNYLCMDCVDRAVNKEGLLVKFYNTGFDGGFESVVKNEKDNMVHR